MFLVLKLCRFKLSFWREGRVHESSTRKIPLNVFSTLVIDTMYNENHALVIF